MIFQLMFVTKVFLKIIVVPVCIRNHRSFCYFMFKRSTQTAAGTRRPIAGPDHLQEAEKWCRIDGMGPSITGGFWENPGGWNFGFLNHQQYYYYLKEIVFKGDRSHGHSHCKPSSRLGAIVCSYLGLTWGVGVLMCCRIKPWWRCSMYGIFT